MAEEPVLDKKRVLKNSIKLYGRTIFTLLVGLYNSRVVLEVLGVDDFGVYSLVGSLVVMFSFFTSTVSSAMSRFFAFELASGDRERLRDTFGTAMLIVAIIALLIITLAESWGSWLVDRLNIPENTRPAAYIVYQFTIATVVLSIIQTCYVSAIIAREKMGIFAYIDIATSTLKLAAIFALKFVMADKLILYSVLVMLVTLSVTSFTIIYCRRNFDECRTWFVFRKPLFTALISYSGWNLYKTLCDTLRPTGVNVVVNLFFGVAVNAAVAIALNVSSNVAKFTANVFLAFKPQIVKSYAMGAFGEMNSMLHNALKFSLLALSVLIVTLIVEMPYVLTLWLGECPAYASLFCRLLCISMFFEVIITIIEFGINATGKIRTFSLLNGTLTISCVGFGALAYYLGAPPEAIYIIQIVLGMACVITDLTLLHRLVPAIPTGSIYRLCAGIALTCIATGCFCALVHNLSFPAFPRLVVVGIADVILTATFTYTFFLSKDARNKILLRLHLRR